MSPIEPPSHLSDGAIEHLRNPLDFPPIDYDDHDGLIAFRSEIHAEWLQANDQLAEPWTHRDDVIAAVPVVWFAADEATLDGNEIIVHFHGGSYWCGSPMTNASLIVPIAQRTGLPVVSVDYRMAPEHPFPAGVDDCLAVVEALSATRRIAAMYGESAGGGLALVTALGMRGDGLTLPDSLGLISPWTDLTLSGDSYRTLSSIDPDFPRPEEPADIAAMYAGDAVADPRVSPLFADHADLPPTLIQVGGREILLSDSTRLASSMRHAGVATTLDVFDGLWHVWHLGHHLPETQQAFDDLASFLVPGS